MEVLLLSKDYELYARLKQSLQFNVIMSVKLDEINKYEVIIISDNDVNYNELFYKLETNEMDKYIYKHIFYMLSNKYTEHLMENILSISKMRNINIIPPKLSIVEIENRILEQIAPNNLSKKNNIITFFGADSKVGTTMIAHSVAEILAMNTEIKIGLLFLNNQPSTNYLKNKNKISLDDIKIKLFNNILKSDEIFDFCIKEENELYILPGANYIPDMRQYHPEHIDKLIQIAANKFNLIIIDAGSNFDSGLAIAALNSTQNKYLVATQQETVRGNFERIANQLFSHLKIDVCDFVLIVNKYIKSNHIYTAGQTADLYKMMLATFIPHLEFIGWQAEIDRKTLIHYENETFNNQIDQLARFIATQTSTPYKKSVTKKVNIVKRAFSNIGGMM
ncbi:MAG: hypothetical protein AB7V16_04490 [Vulcanibacillus sp.]